MESHQHAWSTNEQGHLVHDHDCTWWAHKVCNCGLLHHLKDLDEPEKLYPTIWDDIAREDKVWREAILLTGL